MWYDFLEYDAIDWGIVATFVLLLVVVVLLILYFTTNTVPLQILLLFCSLFIIVGLFAAGYYYERQQKRKNQPTQNSLWDDVSPLARFKLTQTADERAFRNLQRNNSGVSFERLETMRDSRTPSQRSFTENEDLQM